VARRRGLIAPPPTWPTLEQGKFGFEEKKGETKVNDEVAAVEKVQRKKAIFRER
jgi:hypothetical protein